MRNYQTVHRRVFKSGRDSKYRAIRIPDELCDKYGINDKTMIEFVEIEEMGGFLIKKSS
jgi:bifunctional DNA-binding transcriptional regulator/antitoxin component of YhaV-PrlF toxin-antitoxin module